MVYTVTINSKVEFKETTIAACKALVSGLQGIWTIHLTMHENGYRQAIGIIGNNGKVSAFCLGSEFSIKNSEKLLKSFKRSRMEKEVNNTTYVNELEYYWQKTKKIINKNSAEKLLELCGF